MSSAPAVFDFSLSASLGPLTPVLGGEVGFARVVLHNNTAPTSRKPEIQATLDSIPAGPPSPADYVGHLP